MEHLPVELLDEGVSCQEPDSSRQQAINATRNEAVDEEQQRADEARYVQLEHVVPDTINKDPNGATTADGKGLPPPVVVLREISIRTKTGGKRKR